jgi:hypothetical protein
MHAMTSPERSRLLRGVFDALTLWDESVLPFRRACIPGIPQCPYRLLRVASGQPCSTLFETCPDLEHCFPRSKPL